MIGLDKLTLHQGEFSLTDIDIVVPQGEYGILMGSTGCGKTTLLEAICGLRPITSGRVVLDNRDVTNLVPAVRQIGYVPQDAALFPTMRVDRQIEFGMEMRHVNRKLRRKRVEELTELLEITSIKQRYPRGLSGGERQRVALARALSFRPRLLCLDEPLSALDDSTRSRLSNLLGRVHRHEQVTVVHVTHNIVEAEQLGTVKFRMQDGQVTQL